MGIIETLAILLYLGITGYLGFLGYKQTKDETDYLLAGRNTHPFVMAMSYGATFISTAAIVGFGGVAAWLGQSLLWLAFCNIFVGVFIAFVFLGNPTRKLGYRLNAHTFPELLGKRYDSKGVQLFGGLFIATFMPLYAAAVLIGGTHFVAEYFRIDYHVALLLFSVIITAYVIAGGLKGVMLADALQGSVMFVAMILLLFFTFDSLGGITPAFKALGESWQATVEPLRAHPLGEFAPQSPDFLMRLSLAWGFEGWAKMPDFLSEGWLFVITTITLGVGIGVLAQPQLVVRFMTVKSAKELQRAVPIGGIFILVAVAIVFVAGSLSNAWYFIHEGKNALQAAGGVNNVIPRFINDALPSWFGLLFFLALISAAMSTLSSQFHAMGTAIGRDTLEQIFPQSKHHSALVTKAGVLVMILISVSLAYLFDKQPAIIARSTAIFFALCAAIFLPSYLAALFWKRATKAGVFASMATGALTSIFWITLVHFNEAKALGIAKALFGVNSILSGKIIFVDALIIALPLSFFALYLGSILSKPFKESHLKRCF